MHPNTYFLYDPASHYTNSKTIQAALKKNLYQKYYGSMTKSEQIKLNQKYGDFNSEVRFENELNDEIEVVKQTDN